jgi:prepilin-type processing-associated H-X9-DG protein
MVLTFSLTGGTPNTALGANAKVAALTAPVKTVMLFEAMPLGTDVALEHQNQFTRNSGANSVGGYGWPGRIHATNDYATAFGYYATGAMGGGQGNRAVTDYSTTAEVAAGTKKQHVMVGRHLEGSNFLLADGHVKWYKGDQVSNSWMARNSTDAQGADNTDPRNSRAQGTEYAGADAFQVTFSTR